MKYNFNIRLDIGKMGLGYLTTFIYSINTSTIIIESFDKSFVDGQVKS